MREIQGDIAEERPAVHLVHDVARAQLVVLRGGRSGRDAADAVVLVDVEPERAWEMSRRYRGDMWE